MSDEYDHLRASADAASEATGICKHCGQVDPDHDENCWQAGFDAEVDAHIAERSTTAAEEVMAEPETLGVNGSRIEDALDELVEVGVLEVVGEEPADTAQAQADAEADADVERRSRMTRYVLYEDDHETHAAPYDDLDIVEVYDDQTDMFHELVDTNTSIADIKAALS